jgi:hypothetical protein
VGLARDTSFKKLYSSRQGIKAISALHFIYDFILHERYDDCQGRVPHEPERPQRRFDIPHSSPSVTKMHGSSSTTLFSSHDRAAGPFTHVLVTSCVYRPK